MLDFFYNPDEKELDRLLERNNDNNEDILSSVRAIMEDVRTRGDEALYEYALRYDNSDLDSLFVSKEEIDQAEQMIKPELRDAIRLAACNIRTFHETQIREGERCETMEGVELWRKIVPISKPGLYVPGGTAPLFSTVLMLAIPAHVAGCRDIMLATPAKDNRMNPAILYAAKLSGVDRILKVGGAQAIAAFTYGTESVERRNKIFGPGNRFVSFAKMEASRTVSIDMLAGPSEVMVLADSSASPLYIATDLLSQAEHGPDSQAILVFIGKRKDAEEMKDDVLRETERLLRELERSEYMLKSLEHSRILAFSSTEDAMKAVNEYAPEHLIINTADPESLLELVESAGSVFLGPYSPESAGDYASGTNHTLPTSGFAKSSSGVSVDSFIKKITVQKLSRKGAGNIGRAVMEMAEAESLYAHKEAMRVRL